MFLGSQNHRAQLLATSVGLELLGPGVPGCVPRPQEGSEMLLVGRGAEQPRR